MGQVRTTFTVGRDQIKKYIVEVKCFKSHPSAATSDVPQGSNLGLLLVINNLTLRLSCSYLLLAEDLTTTNIKDCHKIQNNINILSEWCSSNELSLNIYKWIIMSYYRLKVL